MRTPIFLGALAVLLLGFSGCLQGQTHRDDVLATFYPVGFLSSRLGSGHLSVGVIVPFDAEPHEYELKPSDLARVQAARLVVYQGIGLEPFAQQIVRAATDHGVATQAAAEGLTTRDDPEGLEGGPDPHLWLDPVLFAAEARNVAKAIEGIDPGNATDYRRNLQILEMDLDGLHSSFEAGLKTCQNRKIITTHAAFGYLAARYNFTMYPISGFEPEAEPSAQKVRETAELARREGIDVIFFETLVSPRVAEVIASEIHGRTAVLDPVEGLQDADVAAGRDYLQIMRQNLANLRDAMRCSG